MTEKRQSATIAAIDVGTNSVHMVIARVDRTGLEVLAAEKEVVRLGEGVNGMDHLSFSAIERGVNALRSMKKIADSHGAVIRAVATSAVREADNREEFLEAVMQTTGINVEVIGGPEEARLIHLGVSRSLNLANESVLTIDIGGGSTEFCVSVKGKVRIAQSLKLGAVRLTDAYLPGGIITDGGMRRLKEKVRTTFAPLAHDIAAIGFSRVILSSGTNETVARIAAARRGGNPPMTFNGFSFGMSELSSVVRTVMDRRDPSSRQEIEGLDPKRADIIAAGVTILHEVTKELEIRQFEFSEYALREGVLIDTATRLGVTSGEEADAGLESAIRIAERFSVDMAHNSHVANLATRVLRAVTRYFETEEGLDRLLRASAYLANSGNAVSHARYHQHSYYIIRNAELMGFTDEEIEVIALVARYHRKSQPKSTHPEFARLSIERQHDVELLAGILRIAVALDRTHDQSVSEISSSNKDGRLTLTVRYSPDASGHAQLNLQSAQNQTELLSRYLGEDVLIKDGGPVSS